MRGADEITQATDARLAFAAVLVAAATILSGPVGLLVAQIHPQPAWKDAATFAASFHPLQQVPFWFGLVLLAACVFFVVRVVVVAGEHHRSRALGALISVAVYAAMVGTNYTLQVAWVPQLARAGDPMVAHLTMTNPGAAAWALEMFGYGALGAATWLLAPMFRAARFGRWIMWLLIANGVVSVASAIITGVDLPWVMTLPGLVCFGAWNILLVAAMALCAIAFVPTRAEGRRSISRSRPAQSAQLMR
jgi:hypothetical protein